MGSAQPRWHVERRDFLKASAWSLVAPLPGRCSTRPLGLSVPLRFGLITDPHYADAPSIGTRYFRDSPDKVREGAAPPPLLPRSVPAIPGTPLTKCGRAWLASAQNASGFWRFSGI